MRNIKVPKSENGSRFDRCFRRLLGYITQSVLEKNINPEPRSGNQEILENYVNRFV